MKAMNTLICRATAVLALLLPPLVSEAAEYLFYFDVSDSTQSDRKAYLQEFDHFIEQRLVPGDRVSVLLLNSETHNFSPIVRGDVKAPSGGLSEKKKREILAAARSDLIVQTAGVLKRTPQANSTNILGALISAGDHFRQESVPTNQRCLVIFTDGIEASPLSKVNMEKQIPQKVPAGLSLPSDLRAEIHMIGIKPPTKPGAQETMRGFWEDAASRTGSKLARYIRAS